MSKGVRRALYGYMDHMDMKYGKAVKIDNAVETIYLRRYMNDE